MVLLIIGLFFNGTSVSNDNLSELVAEEKKCEVNSPFIACSVCTFVVLVETDPKMNSP